MTLGLTFSGPDYRLLSYLTFIALALFLALYASGYIYFMINDRDCLRSEKYTLSKMALEHRLIGDDQTGLIDVKPDKVASTIHKLAPCFCLPSIQMMVLAMTKQFIILTEGFTPENQRTFAELMKEYGWWHHLSNAWLLADPTDTLSAVGLRDTISRINTNAQAFVTEVSVATWAGWMNKIPDVKTRDEWLNKWWVKQD